MSVTFYYPDTTTAVLTFSRAWFRGDDATPVSQVDRDESDSGELSAHAYGDGYVEHSLTVQVPKATQTAPAADVAQLKTFCQTTVQWSVNPFYYTDADGTQHTVKLMNSELRPEQDYVSYTQYKLILREEL